MKGEILVVTNLILFKDKLVIRLSKGYKVIFLLTQWLKLKIFNNIGQGMHRNLFLVLVNLGSSYLTINLISLWLMCSGVLIVIWINYKPYLIEINRNEFT